MRWHYDLTGAEPIIRDLPVYDGTSLANGELMMLGTTANNSADGGISLITAANGTVATQATNAVGILTESTYEVGGTAPTRTNVNTSGVYLGKVIINPMAVYLCEVSNAAAQDVAVESSSTTTTIKETVTANSCDGYWILFVNCATAAIEGSLRQILTTDSTTGVTIAALDATPTTSDNYIIGHPVHALGQLLISGDGTSMTSTGTLLVAASEGSLLLRVLQSYVSSPSVSLTPLMSYISPGQINVGDGGKLFNDLVMLDSAYNSLS